MTPLLTGDPACASAPAAAPRVAEKIQGQLAEPQPVRLRAEKGPTPAKRISPLPRLGFLGVGWIGRNRLEAIARSGLAQVAAIADTSPELAAQAARLAPDAKTLTSLDGLLEEEVQGVVIATPSALHAQQATAALARGAAVFCQKPLGRTEAETRQVVQAAREADRLLSVDFSYRFVTALQRVQELCRTGELGDIYAAELVFHNAYGPDKPWFYEPRLSGGGCVIDLGIHLVDLALWNLGFPAVRNVTSRLFSRGQPLRSRIEAVEDYAEARLDLESGATVRLACSWKLPAGCDAIIQGTFYGTKGGAAFHNVDGSFYHFKAERFAGTRRELLFAQSEEWGGRAVVDWLARLRAGVRFDHAANHLVTVAEVLDRIYRNSEA